MAAAALLIPWLNGQDGEIEGSTLIATATRLVELLSVIGGGFLIERLHGQGYGQPRGTAVLHLHFGAVALLHHGGPRLGPCTCTSPLRCVALHISSLAGRSPFDSYSPSHLEWSARSPDRSFLSFPLLFFTTWSIHCHRRRQPSTAFLRSFLCPSLRSFFPPPSFPS